MVPAAPVPAVSFPADLPISAHVDDIAELIEGNPVVVVAGETGSGKSTQLPKVCLARGRELPGMVAHTQPRRIAAREVASRVATEIGCRLGDTVGYKVRFGERTSAATRVKVVTDGMLLAEMERDRDLAAYHTVIVDEAHERSVNIDFILGYLKRLVSRRPELRVVVTSATIDTARFARHFDDCPVLEVSGRTFAVETRYRPIAADQETDALPAAVAVAAAELWREGPGDILVFLPGEREIREVGAFLAPRLGEDVEILPLYARLSPADQKRIFRPSRGRRVVLATNVAETSLTVPGVRYVVDSGLARVSRYSAARKVQQLPVERISRAAAEQRKGRCGRVRDGICIRLYSEEDFASRPEFTDPEIRRTSLASVVLRMKALNLGEVDDFPFIEPPDRRQVRSGVRLLHEIGALDDGERLTPVGRRLAWLPVEPRIGRLLIEGARRHCLEEMLLIASRLSIADPQVYPPDELEKARRHHASFPEAADDIEAAIALFGAWREQERANSRRGLDRWCRSMYLAPMRMREWFDFYEQLRSLMADNRELPEAAPADAAAVAVAFLSGFLANIVAMDEKGQYRGAGNALVHIHPSSRSFRRKPKWFAAAELVDTGRLYARQVLPVSPEWIERAAGGLLRVSYSEPHFDERSGNVRAFARGTLFGTTVYHRRRVNLGPVDPKTSREVFIADALVPACMTEYFDFAKANRQLLDEAAELARKLRRPESGPDDAALIAFFDEALPERVCSRAGLAHWLKAESGAADRLRIPRAIVIDSELEPEAGRFPDRVRVGGASVELRYHYAPGDPVDGVSVGVPLPLVNQFDPGTVGRQIQGWYAQRVEALVRTLPKSRRRLLQPLARTAAALAASLENLDGDELDNLAAELNRRFGLDVCRDEFDPARLPDHLSLRVELVDDSGAVLDAGRDFAALRARHGAQAAEAFSRGAASGYPRRGLVEWDFGPVPESVALSGYDTAVSAFPALVDQGDHADLELFDNPGEARTQHAAGVLRLAKLARRRLFRELSRAAGLDRTAVRYAGLHPGANLAEAFQDAVIEAALGFASNPPRDGESFARRLDEGRDDLAREARQLAEIVARSIDAAFAVRRALGGIGDAEFRSLVEARLATLVGPPFPFSHPPAWWPHVPRFVAALAARVEKFRLSPEAEIENRRRLAPFVERLESSDAGRHGDALLRYRFMLEEYQVSLFAQKLRTSEPISAKRLDRQWEAVVNS